MRSSGGQAKRFFSGFAWYQLRNRLLTGHYNVINQHQIIFWTKMLLRYLNLKHFFTYQYNNKRALTEQIAPVGLVSMSWITWWKKDVTVSAHKHEGSRWYICCLGIFFSVKVLLVLYRSSIYSLYSNWKIHSSLISYLKKSPFYSCNDDILLI